jgi:AmmeMemoRadiSam system protein B
MGITGRQGGVRMPAVAGLFYPSDPGELRESVGHCLAQARQRLSEGPVAVPKALIVPHAGYVYSGPVAASAYVLIEGARDRIRRVVLLGPSHRVAFRGLALSSAERFTTPLGDVWLDTQGAEALGRLAQVRVLDAAHAEEHSLEVQLPFLQEILGAFRLLPLVAGDATADEVAEVIEAVWGGEETLVLVSSDLSHYYDYGTARALDEATTRAIEALHPDALGEESACGRVPVRGLLLAARRRALAARTLDLRSSGDTAGDRRRVVGYGAYAFA